MEQKRLVWIVAGLVVVGGFTPFITEFFEDKVQYTPGAGFFAGNNNLLHLHVAMDLTLGVTYLALPAVLFYIGFKGWGTIPFVWVLPGVGVFGIGCALTHFAAAYTLWEPAYWLSGVFKYFTAVSSLFMAAAMVPVVPQAISLVESAQVSERRRLELAARGEELKKSNALLEAEIREREKAQRELESANLELLDVLEKLKGSRP